MPKAKQIVSNEASVDETGLSDFDEDLSEADSQMTGRFKPVRRLKKSTSKSVPKAKQIIADEASVDETISSDFGEDLSEADSQKTGRFKPVQRLKKSRSNSESIAEKSSIDKSSTRKPLANESVEISVSKPKEVASLDFDRPTDDEFEIGFDGGISDSDVLDQNFDRPSDDEFEIGFDGDISDSDVLDQKDAADIIARVDAKETSGPSARFKTEIAEEDAASKDRV